MLDNAADESAKLAPPLFGGFNPAPAIKEPSVIGTPIDLCPVMADDPKPDNCNYTSRPKRHRPYRYRIKQPGIIRTGSLVGRHMRHAVDQARRAKALTPDQVREMVNAHTFADVVLGLPCNALMTIVWRHTPRWSGPASWSKLQTVVLADIRRWLKRRRIDTAMVWARERAQGKGAHTHVAIHLGNNPPEIRAALMEWLTRKYQFADEGVDISFGRYGAKTKKMRAGSLRYIAKGLDDEVFRYVGHETSNISAELGIDHRGSQKEIVIKRSGASENLTVSARKRKGWREVRDFPALALLLRPVDGPVAWQDDEEEEWRIWAATG